MKNKKFLWINLIVMIAVLTLFIYSIIVPLPISAGGNGNDPHGTRTAAAQQTATAQAAVPTATSVPPTATVPSAPTATSPAGPTATPPAGPTATSPPGPTATSAPPTATPVPSFTPGSGLIEPDHSYGDLNLSGFETAYLTKGDYIFSSISISGHGDLVVLDGPVRVWVTGAVDIAGRGISNSGQVPTDLILYGTGEDHTWNVRGNGIFYGGIYAPGENLVIRGSGSSESVFGAFLGKTVTFDGTNTNIHYDEAFGQKNSEDSLKLDKNGMTWIID